MTRSTARYDGLADWYEERFVAGAGADHQPGLLDLLGAGSGPCLDIGCGTGRNFETIRTSGRSVVGLDFSADQLRVARTPHRRTADGRGRRRTAVRRRVLRHRDGDVDLHRRGRLRRRSSARRPGYYVRRRAGRVRRPSLLQRPARRLNEDDGSRLIHPNYRQPGWHEESPWWGEDGIRRRVGMRHIPLADYLNAVPHHRPDPRTLRGTGRLEVPLLPWPSAPGGGSRLRRCRRRLADGDVGWGR